MNIFIDTISTALFITFSPPSYRRFNVANNFQWIKIFMNCALYFDIQFILNRQLKVRLKYHIHLHKSWKDRISNFWKSYYLNKKESLVWILWVLKVLVFLCFSPHPGWNRQVILPINLNFLEMDIFQIMFEWNNQRKKFRN